MAVSERTLVRRFGAATGQTPLGYLQSVRLQAARALLEAGDMTVQAIATQVGYSDVSSFTRLFRQEVGISPGSYRRRFHLPADRSRDPDRAAFGGSAGKPRGDSAGKVRRK
jgi:AraC-like DNA-binding protein